MAKKLILIHGRSTKPLEADLRKLWYDAILAGLKRDFGVPGTGPELKEGMVLALEPMVNMGTFKIEVLEDNWTAVTADGKPSVHFEHTVVVRKKKGEILT